MLVFRLLRFTPKDLLIDNNSSINTLIMNFLSIDCSINTGSLFVKTKSKTFSKVLQSDKFNNDLLMKQILDFFKANNLKLVDISQIFVNQGPGNFSGLRGSLATAKGVSLANGINLSGYDTFIWSCAKFFEQKDTIFSLIKYREKYFIKKFDRKLNTISRIEEVTENKIINKYKKNFIVTPKNGSQLFDKRILELDNLSVVALDHNDLEFLKIKGLLDEELVKPLYLT